MVLLEVGLWQSLRTFHKTITSEKAVTTDLHEDPEDFRADLIRRANEGLPGLVGQIYTDAVTACLNVTEYDSDAKTRENLCWKVCALLDQCTA